MRFVQQALLLLLALGMVRGSASGRSWRVSLDGSGDFTSIQAAIDASAGGDEIAVEPGIYHERLFLTGPPIQIRSTHGPKVTFIEADSVGSAVTMMYLSGPGASLEGFTLHGGTGSRLDRGSLLADTTMTSEELRPRDRSVALRLWQEMAGSSGVRAGAGNRQERLGGAILLLAASPTLYELFLETNGADVGGGIYALASAPVLNECRFLGNVAGWGAGAALEHCSHASFNACLWEGNSGAAGGGLALLSTSSSLTDCVFTNNLAGEGGALHVQGRGPAAISLERCLVTRNAAADGSGIYLDDGSLTVSSCTFTANGPSALAGSILYFTTGSDGTLTHSILAQNGALAFVETVGSSLSTSCCDFYDPTGISPSYPREATNFSLDPMFCDSGQGDFRLRQGSPCAPAHSPRACGLLGAFGEPCAQPIPLGLTR